MASHRILSFSHTRDFGTRWDFGSAISLGRHGTCQITTSIGFASVLVDTEVSTCQQLRTRDLCWASFRLRNLGVADVLLQMEFDSVVLSWMSFSFAQCGSVIDG